ncbi:MAG: hypothetical protein ACRD96_26320, partial [Bryobacteraceae bacterium]
MTFRAKLLIAFSATVAVAVGLVTSIVAVVTRNAFARLDDQRTAAFAAQFRREFDRRREDATRRVESIAARPALERIALEQS